MTGSVENTEKCKLGVKVSGKLCDIIGLLRINLQKNVVLYKKTM